MWDMILWADAILLHNGQCQSTEGVKKARIQLQITSDINKASSVKAKTNDLHNQGHSHVTKAKTKAHTVTKGLDELQFCKYLRQITSEFCNRKNTSIYFLTVQLISTTCSTSRKRVIRATSQTSYLG